MSEAPQQYSPMQLKVLAAALQKQREYEIKRLQHDWIRRGESTNRVTKLPAPRNLPPMAEKRRVEATLPKQPPAPSIYNETVFPDGGTRKSCSTKIDRIDGAENSSRCGIAKQEKQNRAMISVAWRLLCTSSLMQTTTQKLRNSNERDQIRLQNGELTQRLGLVEQHSDRLLAICWKFLYHPIRDFFIAEEEKQRLRLREQAFWHVNSTRIAHRQKGQTCAAALGVLEQTFFELMCVISREEITERLEMTKNEIKLWSQLLSRKWEESTRGDGTQRRTSVVVEKRGGRSNSVAHRATSLVQPLCDPSSPVAPKALKRLINDEAKIRQEFEDLESFLRGTLFKIVLEVELADSARKSFRSVFRAYAHAVQEPPDATIFSPTAAPVSVAHCYQLQRESGEDQHSSMPGLISYFHRFPSLQSEHSQIDAAIEDVDAFGYPGSVAAQGGFLIDRHVAFRTKVNDMWVAKLSVLWETVNASEENLRANIRESVDVVAGLIAEAEERLVAFSQYLPGRPSKPMLEEGGMSTLSMTRTIIRSGQELPHMLGLAETYSLSINSLGALEMVRGGVAIGQHPQRENFVDRPRRSSFKVIAGERRGSVSLFESDVYKLLKSYKELITRAEIQCQTAPCFPGVGIHITDEDQKAAMLSVHDMECGSTCSYQQNTPSDFVLLIDFGSANGQPLPNEEQRVSCVQRLLQRVRVFASSDTSPQDKAEIVLVECRITLLFPTVTIDAEQDFDTRRISPQTVFKDLQRLETLQKVVAKGSFACVVLPPQLFGDGCQMFQWKPSFLAGNERLNLPPPSPSAGTLSGSPETWTVPEGYAFDCRNVDQPFPLLDKLRFYFSQSPRPMRLPNATDISSRLMLVDESQTAFRSYFDVDSSSASEAPSLMATPKALPLSMPVHGSPSSERCPPRGGVCEEGTIFHIEPAFSTSADPSDEILLLPDGHVLVDETSKEVFLGHRSASSCVGHVLSSGKIFRFRVTSNKWTCDEIMKVLHRVHFRNISVDAQSGKRIYCMQMLRRKLAAGATYGKRSAVAADSAMDNSAIPGDLPTSLLFVELNVWKSENPTRWKAPSVVFCRSPSWLMNTHPDVCPLPKEYFPQVYFGSDIEIIDPDNSAFSGGSLSVGFSRFGATETRRETLGLDIPLVSMCDEKRVHRRSAAFFASPSAASDARDGFSLQPISAQELQGTEPFQRAAFQLLFRSETIATFVVQFERVEGEAESQQSISQLDQNNEPVPQRQPSLLQSVSPVGSRLFPAVESELRIIDFAFTFLPNEVVQVSTVQLLLKKFSYCYRSACFPSSSENESSVLSLSWDIGRRSPTVDIYGMNVEIPVQNLSAGKLKATIPVLRKSALFGFNSSTPHKSNAHLTLDYEEGSGPQRLFSIVPEKKNDVVVLFAPDFPDAVQGGYLRLELDPESTETEDLLFCDIPTESEVLNSCPLFLRQLQCDVRSKDANTVLPNLYSARDRLLSLANAPLVGPSKAKASTDMPTQRAVKPKRRGATTTPGGAIVNLSIPIPSITVDSTPNPAPQIEGEDEFLRTALGSVIRTQHQSPGKSPSLSATTILTGRLPARKTPRAEGFAAFCLDPGQSNPHPQVQPDKLVNDIYDLPFVAEVFSLPLSKALRNSMRRSRSSSTVGSADKHRVSTLFRRRSVTSRVKPSFRSVANQVVQMQSISKKFMGISNPPTRQGEKRFSIVARCVASLVQSAKTLQLLYYGLDESFLRTRESTLLTDDDVAAQEVAVKVFSVHARSSGVQLATLFARKSRLVFSFSQRNEKVLPPAEFSQRLNLIKQLLPTLKFQTTSRNPLLCSKYVLLTLNLPPSLHASSCVQMSFLKTSLNVHVHDDPIECIQICDSAKLCYTIGATDSEPVFGHENSTKNLLKLRDKAGVRALSFSEPSPDSKIISRLSASEAKKLEWVRSVIPYEFSSATVPINAPLSGNKKDVWPPLPKVTTGTGTTTQIRPCIPRFSGGKMSLFSPLTTLFRDVDTEFWDGGRLKLAWKPSPIQFAQCTTDPTNYGFRIQFLTREDQVLLSQLQTAQTSTVPIVSARRSTIGSHLVKLTRQIIQCPIDFCSIEKFPFEERFGLFAQMNGQKKRLATFDAGIVIDNSTPAFPSVTVLELFFDGDASDDGERCITIDVVAYIVSLLCFVPRDPTQKVREIFDLSLEIRSQRDLRSAATNLDPTASLSVEIRPSFFSPSEAALELTTDQQFSSSSNVSRKCTFLKYNRQQLTTPNGEPIAQSFIFVPPTSTSPLTQLGYVEVFAIPGAYHPKDTITLRVQGTPFLQTRDGFLSTKEGPIAKICTVNQQYIRFEFDVGQTPSKMTWQRVALLLSCFYFKAASADDNVGTPNNEELLNVERRLILNFCEGRYDTLRRLETTSLEIKIRVC